MADRQRSWPMPGAPDLAFGIVLMVGLLGGRTGFLNDPGTFWHVELGRQIANAGDVPRVDGFTYTRGGSPWVDQSWAFDLGLAALVDRWGWSGAVAATALGLAWIYGALARGLCRDGTTPAVAAFVAVIAAGVGALHFLTRPHLFTFALVLWTLRACRAYHDRGSKAILTVPIAVGAWANLHGGFLAGPLIVATAALGHAISGGPRDATRRRRLAGFVAIFGLSLLAPLANPYGPGLYGHVAGLLVGSKVTDLIIEYQPVPFGRPDAMVLEWVVLALIGLAAFSKNRPERYELAHLLVWLHLALGSVRHAPLFAIAAAPTLARLLDGLVAPPDDPEQAERQKRWTAWPMLVSLALVIAVGSGARLGSLDRESWPLAALPSLNREPTDERLFHEQDWGGLIESECRPRRATFLDDRFELFGRGAILKYVAALEGGPGWDALDREHGFGLVWVRPDRGLARRLDAEPGWEAAYRDKSSVLFRRRSAPTGAMAQGPE